MVIARGLTRASSTRCTAHLKSKREHVVVKVAKAENSAKTETEARKIRAEKEEKETKMVNG